MATAGDFLTEHRDRLRALFEVLGEHDLEDDDELVHWMERRWLGAEHGPGEGKRAFTPEQSVAAWPLLQELGLVDRVRPRRRDYDEVVVLGASGIGLYRRLGLVRESAVAAPVLSVLAGQRPHQGLDRDGGAGELLADDGRFAAADGWRPPPNLVHVAAALDAAGVDPLVAARAVVPSETDLARLLLHKHWPGLRLREVVASTGRQEVVNELGPRDVVWEVHGADGPIPEVRLLNGAPVERFAGDGTELPRRPTTRSTLREWLDDARDRAPRSVLVVVNQPHLTRVALDVGEELSALPVVPEVEIAGCEVLRGSIDLNLVLGEIPARINAERAGRKH